MVASLGRHDIGYHSDGHSLHPTVVEYLAARGWEDGVEEALRRERPGLEAIRDVFGRMPSCWGGPGNTWGPQIHEAMRRLGVPAVVYAHTRVPGGDVHRFCELLSYPYNLSVNDAEYHLDGLWECNLARVTDGLIRLRSEGAQWAEVFAGHPSRIFHEEFWDGANFVDGRSPPPEQWREPRRKSDADVTRALRNLEKTVRHLVALEGIELSTIAEMNDAFASAAATGLEPAEIDEIRPVIEANLRGMRGWPILPRDIDVSRIVALTLERLPTLGRLRLP